MNASRPNEATRGSARAALARTLIEFPDSPLDWEALFPERRPVHVEIGSGKGRFLIRAAEAEPRINWVGLERRWSTLSLAAMRILSRGLVNAVIVRCDALEVVRRLVRPGTVAGFHVYYPDPWWKKRHHKRRVFTPEFVDDLARGLEEGGELRVATDVPEYFEEIVAAIRAPGIFAPVELPQEAWMTGGEPLTSYEAKYLDRGKRSHRAAFRRGPGTVGPPAPWLSRKPYGAPLAERLLLPRLESP